MATTTGSAARAPLLEEVQSIFGDNLTLHFDNGDPAQGIDLDRLLENPSEGEHVYVCGPAGLVGSVREKAAHWPAGTVHWEPFTPETDQAPQKNEVFEVVLSRRNVRLEVPIDKTILEVVREAGVDIESSCEDGLCGCCSIGLLGGVPREALGRLPGRLRGAILGICSCHFWKLLGSKIVSKRTLHEKT